MNDEQLHNEINRLADGIPSSSPHAALHRFHNETLVKRRFATMNTTRNAVFSGLAAVLLLVLAFSFPATRALAGQFLGVFRVQKFAPISVSPAQLQMLENLEMDEGLYPGEIVFAEDGIEGRDFDNLADAAAFAQSESTAFYGVRTLAELGDPSEIHVEGGGTATLTVNLEGARALLEAINADPAILPDSLDGQDVTADTDVMLGQMWDDVMLMQMPSPVFNYPTDVNPAPIGQALLQLLGMEESEARRLSESIDWTNTLLMPIPTEFATFREVPIDGTTGLLIEAVDGGETALMWQNGGMVYMLGGGSSGDELLESAESLTWTFFD